MPCSFQVISIPQAYVFVPLEVQPVYKEADIINVQINFYELNPAI